MNKTRGYTDKYIPSTRRAWHYRARKIAIKEDSRCVVVMITKDMINIVFVEDALVIWRN